MVWVGGKTGKTDNNLSENATHRNREPVGELARAWSCVTHSDRGLSHPDARPWANMPRDWPKFANRRSRTRRPHVRARPVRRPTTKQHALCLHTAWEEWPRSKGLFARSASHNPRWNSYWALLVATAKARFPRRHRTGRHPRGHREPTS